MTTPRVEEVVAEIVYWERHDAELRQPTAWAALLKHPYLQPWLEAKLTNELEHLMLNPVHGLYRDSHVEGRLLTALSEWNGPGKELCSAMVTYIIVGTDGDRPELNSLFPTCAQYLRGSQILCGLIPAKMWIRDQNFHLRVKWLMQAYDCTLVDFPRVSHLKGELTGAGRLWMTGPRAPFRSILDHIQSEEEKEAFRCCVGELLLKDYLDAANRGVDHFGTLLSWLDDGLCVVQAVRELFVGNGFPGVTKGFQCYPPVSAAQRKVEYWLPKMRPDSVKDVLSACMGCPQSYKLVLEILEVWLREEPAYKNLRWNETWLLREVPVGELLGKAWSVVLLDRDFLIALCRLLPIARLDPPLLAGIWFVQGPLKSDRSSYLASLPRELHGLLGQCLE